MMSRHDPEPRTTSRPAPEKVMDLRGLNPAPVTVFTKDGQVDWEQNVKLAKWLVSVEGVKSLVILGHAGEGTFLDRDEQVKLIETLAEAVDVPIIAGITGEGTEVAAKEAKRAADAGAIGALVYPSHGWLRFGYQAGAPQDRYKAIYEASGLQCILFQYPDVTKATYNLQTQLEIAAQPGVVATKNGVRNMKRWDTEIPVLRSEFPDLQILTCHDEYLLHTMFDVDGALVGYGNVAPELLVQLIEAGKAKDYVRARKLHDQLLPVTKNIYHRGSHMEGTVALKIALRARGIIDNATIRSPLLDLTPEAEAEIEAALKEAGII
ncbi:dihydrodipicolinate synthase family protein [Sphingomonas sp. CFBP8993]|uniref:dihydrodipicolinate synthase family protein n=1 Tax=Sphingomonas sp. CFBP8993 TaxID=3096526 RepID=UPI002A6B15DC|nr:dihydrodipicolinate synthase family protein [Sphingomonas sp. CFBP8993]